ncbi:MULTISPECIES: hypothetical protein [Streptomyces]|uniref:Uncharacterized protein n=1 Tax=Streptomyces tricolor TaxID=68277 RepID=A0ABS9JQK7_9ACTN|nr:hypothetical protein [Streptomyces tricolor]MCG0067855.1 hypothetical protein [Streptomyces tricolor]
MARLRAEVAEAVVARLRAEVAEAVVARLRAVVAEAVVARLRAVVGCPRSSLRPPGGAVTACAIAP